METTYHEIDDLPVTVDTDSRRARAWSGSSSWPIPFTEVVVKGRPISQREFDRLRRLAAKLAP
jgi:hypothetical protein